MNIIYHYNSKAKVNNEHKRIESKARLNYPR